MNQESREIGYGNREPFIGIAFHEYGAIMIHAQLSL